MSSPCSRIRALKRSCGPTGNNQRSRGPTHFGSDQHGLSDHHCLLPGLIPRSSKPHVLIQACRALASCPGEACLRQQLREIRSCIASSVHRGRPDPQRGRLAKGNRGAVGCPDHPARGRRARSGMARLAPKPQRQGARVGPPEQGRPCRGGTSREKERQAEQVPTAAKVAGTTQSVASQYQRQVNAV
jgi:hypothetical protein